MADTPLARLGLRATEYGNSWGLAVSASEPADSRGSLIALHGGLDRGTSFARLARRLPQWRVYAPDRRGYGGSRGLGIGTVSDHVSDIRRLVDEISPVEPLVIFGHSFGGVVALALAADSDLEAHVVVYEPPLPWFTTMSNTLRALAEDPAAGAEQFFRDMIGDAIWERLGEDARHERRLDGPALQADLACLHAEVPFDVSSIHQRVTYAYGDSSHQPYYADCVSGLERAGLEFAVRELSPATHGAHLAQPEIVARLITSTVEP